MIRNLLLILGLSVFLTSCAKTNMPDQRLSKESNFDGKIYQNIVYSSVTKIYLDAQKSLVLNFGLFKQNSKISDSSQMLDSSELKVLLNSSNNSNELFLDLNHENQVINLHYNLHIKNQSYETVIKNVSIRTLLRDNDNNKNSIQLLMRFFPLDRFGKKVIRAGVFLIINIQKDQGNFNFKSFKTSKEVVLTDPIELDFETEVLALLSVPSYQIH